MSDFSQNLSNALNALKQQETDVANAIRHKKGYSSTQKINPQDFASEIAGISTVGGTGLQNYYASAQHQERLIPITFYAGSSETISVHYDNTCGYTMGDGDVLDIDIGSDYVYNHNLAFCFYIYFGGFTNPDVNYTLDIGGITIDSDGDVTRAMRLNVIYYDDNIYVYIWR